MRDGHSPFGQEAVMGCALVNRKVGMRHLIVLGIVLLMATIVSCSSDDPAATPSEPADGSPEPTVAFLSPQTPSAATVSTADAPEPTVNVAEAIPAVASGSLAATNFIEPGTLIGTPCTSPMGPTLGDDTLGGDLVQGWAFTTKHEVGFADHGCLRVSASDGYPTRSGSHSLRFEVRSGDCNANSGWDDCTTDRSRHELTQSDLHQYDGDEYWYTWSVLLPESPLKQGDSITFLGQFNSDNAARFYIEDFPTGLGFRFNDRNYEFIGRDVLIANEHVRGVWTDILIHAIWSTVDNGLIEIHINGDLVKTLIGPNMDGATLVTFDFGIYNAFISDCECEVMPTQVAYFDEIHRGQTRQEVELQR
jgi:hypothetical protein